jgi:hypothetical protein
MDNILNILLGACVTFFWDRNYYEITPLGKKVIG